MLCAGHVPDGASRLCSTRDIAVLTDSGVVGAGGETTNCHVDDGHVRGDLDHTDQASDGVGHRLGMSLENADSSAIALSRAAQNGVTTGVLYGLDYC